MIYKLAKTRNRRTKDISDNIYMSDADGNILTDHEKIKDRWHDYFEELFNVTNARKEPDKCDETEGPIPRITEDEIRKQLRRFALAFIHSHSGATGVFRNAFMVKVAVATSCLQKTLQTT